VRVFAATRETRRVSASTNDDRRQTLRTFTAMNVVIDMLILKHLFDRMSLGIEMPDEMALKEQLDVIGRNDGKHAGTRRMGAASAESCPRYRQLEPSAPFSSAAPRVAGERPTTARHLSPRQSIPRGGLVGVAPDAARWSLRARKAGMGLRAASLVARHGIRTA
jgi:hypothetical protein